MTPENFMYWLEGYVDNSAMNVCDKIEIMKKIREVRKAKEEKEPIIPAQWPQGTTLQGATYHSSFTGPTSTSTKQPVQQEIPFED